MRPFNKKISSFVPLLLIAVLAVCCSRDPLIIESTATPIDDLHSTDGPILSNDSCDCDDPMQDLRWLRVLANHYKDDSVNHLAVYRTVDMNGQKRILTAIFTQYPFDMVVLYNYCGAPLDTLPYTSQALVHDAIDPSAMVCIYQNYSHIGPDGPCHVANPMADMPWLSYFALTYEQAQVQGEVYSCLFEYQDEIHDGFLLNQCVNCSDTMTELYDCLGNELASFPLPEGQSADSPYHIIDSTLTLIYRNY